MESMQISCHNTAYLFFGIPGSGKSTQRKKLAETFTEEKLSFIQLDTGSLIRDFIASKKKTALAIKIQQVLDKGALLPSSFPVWLWMNTLVAGYRDGDAIIVDGGGRKPIEAKLLVELLAFIGVDTVKGVLLEVSDENAIERLGTRGRPDDADESVQHRLQIYRDEKEGTTGSITFLEKHPQVQMHHIDGSGTPQDVHTRLLKTLFPNT